MSLLRLIYLGLAIWGAVHPMYWFVQWFRAEGWDIMAMVDAWHANMATTGLVWDLTIAAVALTIFVLSEVAVRRNWVALRNRSRISECFIPRMMDLISSGWRA